MAKNKRLKLGLVVLSLLTLVSIGGCVSAGEPTDGGGTGWQTIILVVLMIGIFYFLLIRPQRKRQKQHQELMQELRNGDRVITTGGIYGRIESLSEDSVILKIESGSTIRVARGSIAGKQEKY